MVEYYECVCRLCLAFNPKIKSRAWLAIGRMLKNVGLSSTSCTHKTAAPDSRTRLLHSIACFLPSLPPSYFPLSSLPPPSFSSPSLPPPRQSPFIETLNVSYCGLDDQGLTLLLRSVRANCALRTLHMDGNNLSGKGSFILSECN